MTISIAGRHMEVSETFKVAGQQGIQDVCDKYQISYVDAHITLSKNNLNFHTDINLHMNKNMNLRVSGEASDAYISLQLALETLHNKVRKYKKRLTDHHRHHDIHHEELAYKILNNTNFDEVAEDHSIEELAPTIVAEIKTSFPTICVSDAVMRFDLENENAFVFRNAANQEINVLYRRKDGNIGWIDPQR